ACGGGMVVRTLAEGGVGDPEEVAAAGEGAQRGIERLTPVQLLQCSAEQLLARGFTDHDLRLFRGSPVRFECRCSQGRVAGLLRAPGPGEVRGGPGEQGAVTGTCEVCHRPPRFEAVDIEALFAPDSSTGRPDADQSNPI